MKKYSQRKRDHVVAAFVAGATQKETAKRFGISVHTVRAWLIAARARKASKQRPRQAPRKLDPKDLLNTGTLVARNSERVLAASGIGETDPRVDPWLFAPQASADAEQSHSRYQERRIEEQAIEIRVLRNVIREVCGARQ